MVGATALPRPLFPYHLSYLTHSMIHYLFYGRGDGSASSAFPLFMPAPTQALFAARYEPRLLYYAPIFLTSSHSLPPELSPHSYFLELQIYVQVHTEQAQPDLNSHQG